MSIEYELPLSFRPTKELKEAIIKQAQIEDRPVSNMIRRLVRLGLTTLTQGPDWQAIAEACVAKHNRMISAAEVREMNEPHKEAIAAAVDAERGLAATTKGPDWEGGQE